LVIFKKEESRFLNSIYSYFLISRTLKTAFTWLGTQMASGIEKGGNYISSKVDKKEKVEVSSETK